MIQHVIQWGHWRDVVSGLEQIRVGVLHHDCETVICDDTNHRLTNGSVNQFLYQINRIN